MAQNLIIGYNSAGYRVMFAALSFMRPTIFLKEVSMKKLARLLTVLALTAGLSFALVDFAWAKLPADMQEFSKMYETEATTPEGAAKLWLSAAFLYSDASTRGLGRNMLIEMMKGLPKDFERNSAHAAMVDRLKNEPQTQRSFCAGSSPENGYAADVQNCEITVTGSKEGYDGQTWQVFLKSSGADSPRQITLIKDGKYWKVWQAAGLYMGIKPAVKQ